MDDGDVAEEADMDIVGLEVGNRDGICGLAQEPGPVNERAIGITAIEVLSQDLVEACWTERMYSSFNACRIAMSVLTVVSVCIGYPFRDGSAGSMHESAYSRAFRTYRT
jgi:hypothetical protein